MIYKVLWLQRLYSINVENIQTFYMIVTDMICQENKMMKSLPILHIWQVSFKQPYQPKLSATMVNQVLKQIV